MGRSRDENVTLLLPANRQISLPALSILVAEDNSVNQMVISGILKRLGQSVTLVDDGDKAYQTVMESHQQYDLVLMDCDMPVMDGMAATRKIREWEAKVNAKPIQIVALTAHAIQAQITACFDAGMNDYLAKPIDICKLEDLLSSLADMAIANQAGADSI